MQRVFALLFTLIATAFHMPLQAGVPGGYGLVWSDEFDGPDNSAPSNANWNYDTGCGGYGNNEWQNYTTSTNNSYITSDAAAVDGKALVMKAFNTGGGSCGYTSARLHSNGKRSFQYGYIEARLKLPFGQGIWPAFWMMGTDIGSVGWPACGEIDVMENIGRTSEWGRSYGTIHGPGYSGAGGLSTAYNLPAGTYFKDAYHTFAIRWEANVIDFYVDGNLFTTRTPASLPGGSAWAFNHPFYFLLNLAVGGNWPGYPDGTTTFPQEYRVDYIRVYQQGVGPTPTFTPTQTPHPVPGRIQSEDYHGHFDTTAGNTGGAYRNDNVDIEATTDAGGGFNVAWNDAGDWMDYRINVASAGTYNMVLRVASNMAGPMTLNLQLDGAALGGAITVNGTGGWQNWVDLPINGLALPAGIHMLRFNLGGGYNLNYFDLSLVPPSPTRTRTRTLTSTLTLTTTASPTRTPTQSSTRSSTPLSTPSFTPSFTRTPTSSHTSSPTAPPSPTRTPTSTPPDSPTYSPSPLPSGSATLTTTLSPVQSPTQTFQASATPSFTEAPSNTASPTSSLTPALSPSITQTPSATVPPSFTATPSLSSTQSSTPGASLTQTPASSGTFSPLPSATHTPPQPSSTATSSPAPSTSLPTLTATSTVTRTPASTSTPSPTQAPATSTPQPPDTLVIEKVLPAPNPNPLVFYARLSGPCDRIETRIYSAGRTLVRQFETGPHHYGWTLVLIPPDFAYGAPNGTYHYRMTALRGGQSSASVLGTFLMAR